MRLNHNLHLAYCTNVHPGETWEETFGSLNRWTLPIKERLGNPEPYAIGLRLSDKASKQLNDPKCLIEFQRWLDQHGCYVFTINGFPFGAFHGTRVKEQVYAPDWTARERVAYTKRLFDLLSKLVPASVEGSVSTLPGSFKEFNRDKSEIRLIRANLWECVEHAAKLSADTGSMLHLGLEPEPLGLFENSQETIQFFDELKDEHPNDERLDLHLGVNYDTCHLAVEFESPHDALSSLRDHGIRLSKIHLSSALRLRPSAGALKVLRDFADDVYLHQVIVRAGDGTLKRHKDLTPALASFKQSSPGPNEEWRVHFHVPLGCETIVEFQTTADHVTGLMDWLKAQPRLCSHLEMETYTWAVLPEPLKTRDVTEQIVNEYRWTLNQLAKRGLAAARNTSPI
ncbi:MAG TPA: metabolite traffic protein EboE [Verrucomicrobiae bacterium]|nr:metabolite traffic protein EboE [Verrucomicrobiae bacterium]